jgi:hypothetical protein
MDLDKENSHINDLLKDHSSLTLKFQEFEENILKLMENKQEIEKEYEKSKIENELEIKNLIHQEVLAKAELDKVSLLNEKDNKVIRELKKNFSEFGTNSEVSLMVNDLYSVAILEEDGYNPKNKNRKKKKDADLIEEIIIKLKVKFFIFKFIIKYFYTY